MNTLETRRVRAVAEGPHGRADIIRKNGEVFNAYIEPARPSSLNGCRCRLLGYMAKHPIHIAQDGHRDSRGEVRWESCNSSWSLYSVYIKLTGLPWRIYQ